MPLNVGKYVATLDPIDYNKGQLHVNSKSSKPALRIKRLFDLPIRLRYIQRKYAEDYKIMDDELQEVVGRYTRAMVESKAKSFVNELRKRYNVAFAAFVVDNMRKQNMLKEDKIAELLKDNPNEK